MTTTTTTTTTPPDVPPPPPRLTGDPKADIATLNEYLWQYYRNTVEQGYFTTTQESTTNIENITNLITNIAATPYTIGDLITASSASEFELLPDVALGSVLISKGVGIKPAWGRPLVRCTLEATNATPTPNIDTSDVYALTALAAAAAFAAPTGTPAEGQKLIVRIKDNGTARALSWNAAYRASADLALPTTTVLSKSMYLGFIYNTEDLVYDLIAFLNNF